MQIKVPTQLMSDEKFFFPELYTMSYYYVLDSRYEDFFLGLFIKTLVYVD